MNLKDAEFLDMLWPHIEFIEASEHELFDRIIYSNSVTFVIEPPTTAGER